LAWIGARAFGKITIWRASVRRRRQSATIFFKALAASSRRTATMPERAANQPKNGRFNSSFFST